MHYTVQTIIHFTAAHVDMVSRVTVIPYTV